MKQDEWLQLERWMRQTRDETHERILLHERDRRKAASKEHLQRLTRKIELYYAKRDRADEMLMRLMNNRSILTYAEGLRMWEIVLKGE